MGQSTHKDVKKRCTAFRVFALILNDQDDLYLIDVNISAPIFLNVSHNKHERQNSMATTWKSKQHNVFLGNRRALQEIMQKDLINIDN